jgi:hypothetical protein
VIDGVEGENVKRDVVFSAFLHAGLATGSAEEEMALAARLVGQRGAHGLMKRNKIL